ncbi:M20 metallopeptidase family protein [Lysinibacillus pakistanensis]|uniref:Amidohydrolase n=1 Tax=Lysinibacillus pakistanensis TaxID=759811 RepID=A0AAX3WZF0_9BACI|nr:amidohydrolase [Lysinibacillus pakistanensis]MDM5232194.1 amidohydrolase [Lysinibacillus pakistanensis]WHY47713.1 amidohydrolase [Lysinibacillus pakistanensis]WHY52724.1 amidohydrolase [Lysinibacillus pakistanensis]
MEIHNLESLAKKAIDDRRYLHQYPELSGEEFETSKFIRNRLMELNIDILSFEPPSVVGWIRGTIGSKTIALRADIDALPIVEEGDKPYISKTPGIAHMCGHDGHTAILLAVAEWLSNNEVEPNIVLIFQSAEEITPSGADLLIKQGVLEGVDAIFGIHLWQGLEKGKIGLTHGSMMASVDDFEIDILGYGGHGSMPHETIDPIYIASNLIQSFQSIISRGINPIEAGVITVGKVQAGTTYNIIPDSARLIGTIRALTPETVTTIQTKMANLTEGICQAFGAKAEVRFIIGTPPLINDPKESSFVQDIICREFSHDVFEVVEPVMGGEDFSYYLQKKPGAFIFVGMGGEKSQYPHHHPQFDLDEDVFPKAIKLFIEIINQYK